MSPERGAGSLVIVVAAVIVEEGRVLLTRRPGGVHLAGAWEFPGGKVEPGETPRGALAREIREELGVDGEVGEPFAFNDHAYPDRHILLLTYQTRLEGTPRPLGCDGIDWFGPKEIRGLSMPPADGPIVRRLLALLRQVDR